MLKLLFFIPLLLIGCDTGFIAARPVTIDEAVLPYLEQYKIDKYTYTGISTIKPISIYFFTLQGQAVGVCETYNTGKRIIRLDPDFWFSHKDGDRIAVLYHELGHCDLDLDHNPDGNTIMAAHVLDGDVFDADPNYYLNLLFTEGK